MSPEEKNIEESQEEFGWEDLSDHDDGRPDMGDQETEPTSDPTPEPEEAAAAEEPEVTPEPEGPTGEAAATPEEPEERIYTLPGGEKIKESDLVSNPDLLNKLVTHSNQVSYFQQLAEQRQQQLTAAEQERRRMLDEYTQWEMSQRMQAPGPAQQPVPQRPPTQALEGVYGPHLDALVQQGRLSEDHRNEFGGLVAEYLYDVQNMYNLIGGLTNEFQNQLNGVTGVLAGDLIPETERRRQIDAVQEDQAVQAAISKRPGYESLSNPEEWERLRSFILQKVAMSPIGADGTPTFNPIFDVDTMAQMYDAMTGADLRATLQALKTNATKQDAKKTSMAGGESTAKAGTPPPRKPSKMTPEEEALDWSDPTMATG